MLARRTNRRRPRPDAASADRGLLSATLLVLALGLVGEAQARVGAVIDDAGIPVKLIATRDGSLHAQADPQSRSAPAKIFGYWYVLPPDPESPSNRFSDLTLLTKDGFYRVASGHNASDYRGWIAEENAIRWSHRQALRPAPRKGREPVRFYESREAALTAVRTGQTGAATHREPADSEQRLIVMPILGVEEVMIDGDPVQVYRIAFVSALPGVVGAAGILPQVTMDLVFVVDTTASMANPIAQVRTSIARVAHSLGSRPELQKRLRLGLVGYRDTVDGRDPGRMEYVSRVYCDLSEGVDHQLFLDRLANVKVVRAGSAGYPEDVLAGISTAMDPELKWTPYSWKQIVVVGDSSAREPGHPDLDSRTNAGGRTIDAILDRAQKASSGSGTAPTDSFVISAVRIKNPTHGDDHVIGDLQLGRLVAGRRYQGKMISARGGAEPEDFSSRLTSFLLGGLEEFEELVLGSGGGRTITATHLSAADFPYPVLDLIRQLPDEEAQGEDPRFAIRYCTDLDADGNRVLIPHLFARKGSLKTFVSFLDFMVGLLEDAGEPGARDVEHLVSQLRATTVSLQIDEPISAELNLDKVFSGILGIPLKTNVFKLTLGELAAMNAARYQEWVQSVNASKQTLADLADNPNIWFGLHPSAKNRDFHAFIALSDLP